MTRSMKLATLTNVLLIFITVRICQAQEICSSEESCYQSSSGLPQGGALLQVHAKPQPAQSETPAEVPHSQIPDTEVPTTELISPGASGNANEDDQVSFRDWRKHYSDAGRQPDTITPGDIFVDYEVQFGWLRLSPDIILDSLYAKAYSHRSCASSSGPLFGDVSTWFSLGTDGASLKRQFLMSTLEATSKRMMRPKEVLDSDFPEQLQSFVDSTKVAGAVIPGTQDLVTMQHRGGPDLMQWTVGLHLSQVPILMNHSGGSRIWSRTEEQCKDKPMLYKALVSLAAMTVEGVAGQRGRKRFCKHAKRYLNPWIVRTHFGDIVKYVASKVGKYVLQALPEDVLTISQVPDNATAFPYGVIDYLHFLEVAELLHLTPPVASTPEQLCFMAQQVFVRRKQGRRKIRRLGCGVYGFNTTGTVKALVQDGVSEESGYLSAIASPKQWLNSLLEGHDLWTDQESLLSRNTKTNLIFKSMGAWRMAKAGGQGEGYVYLESVGGKQNLRAHKYRNTTTGEKMRIIATRLNELPWHEI